ncbi:multidrug transporter subunit MdtN [Rhodobacteraceae bacterium NNCM2]|nr:multidrug transporter subunit MdtN [Coraliihabitans acroporae]
MGQSLSRRLAILAGAVVSLGIIGAAAMAGYRGYQNSAANPLSDDATFNAEVVQIAASVAGRVTAVHVRENDMVRKGDLVVELDDTPYRLAVEQTEADLAIAIAANRDQERNIRAKTANAAIAGEQVERAKANLELATQTLDRLLPMRSKGYVSAQQVDDARTAQRDAQVSLNEALKQVEAAEVLIGDEEAAQALIRARQAAVAIAKFELAGTKVYAPADGRVVGLTAQTGSYTLPAQSLFTLIDTSSWYVSANYTETVLPSIRAGDCATVYALSDREREISGVVEGIGWGIAPKDVIQLPSSLPIVPKSLDWVRVQQRFPVRIRLMNPPEDLMRVGASAVSIVHDDESC